MSNAPSPSVASVARACAWLLAGLTTLVTSARAEKLVTVRSVVDPAYAARRAATRPPRTETFVVARGQYFNAIPMDSYLERMDFPTIAARLATDLQPRGFLPAKNFAAADLVLVIHWGVTLANETSRSQFLPSGDLLRDAEAELAAADQASNDMSLRGRVDTATPLADAALNYRREASTVVFENQRDPSRGRSNAELLGFETGLYEEDQNPFGSALGETLRLMVNEERYFIIIAAYDAPNLRQGRKQRLWTTRASIRAAGVNFAIALDRMSSTAANHHGMPQSGLAFETSVDRPVKSGTVTIGEIKVLGNTGSAPAKSAGK